MINQLIVGCGHAVMAEALLLAESAGIDAARIPAVLAGGHADGTLLQKLYPRMVAARFRAAGLCAPAAQGPRDGQRVCRRPEGAGADGRRGAVALSHADPPAAMPSSIRRRCSSYTSPMRTPASWRRSSPAYPQKEVHTMKFRLAFDPRNRCWRRPRLVALPAAARRSSSATPTSAWPMRRRRCTPTRWRSWSRSAPMAASRSRCSPTRSSAASTRWSTA